MQIDQASLGMPDRSYLLRGLNDSAVRGYYNLMVESAVILGADRTRAESDMLQGMRNKIGRTKLPLPANLPRILITVPVALFFLPFLLTQQLSLSKQF